jgi:leucyl/phenylalanyl-tRNA--protein transferase
MFRLSKNSLDFPPVQLANKHGLLAFGGDLSTQRLIKAYSLGIFPWYEATDPILWWSPDPRMVLYPQEIKISKSMRSLRRKNLYRITQNKAFKQVIDYCSKVPRAGQNGTWLHQDMIDTYNRLFELGKAFSVEVWNQKGILVGGLYGVKSAPKVWTGESMFHLEANTSKLAFIHLAEMAQQNDIDIIDCQLYTDHLASLGAREIPREVFVKHLQLEVEQL